VCKREGEEPFPDRLCRCIRIDAALYTGIIVGFGVGFTMWARRIGHSWPVVFSIVLFIVTSPCDSSGVMQLPAVPLLLTRSGAMRVGGVLETALYVADITRAAEFYRRLFGFPTLLESERLIALDVAGKDVLLLFPAGGTTAPFPVPGGDGFIPPHGGSPGGYHFAFSIAAEDMDSWQRHLETEGVAVESVVRWPGGARSIYFRDPDGNLAELICPGFWAIY
jgi:catechol 2,3-dioxygenase-like lactoylglutathione lyase family enzyme